MIPVKENPLSYPWPSLKRVQHIQWHVQSVQVKKDKNMLKIGYIKHLKTLYLKAPNESHSCILLFNVLYNIAPLYRNDLLLTHRSLLGT